MARRIIPGNELIYYLPINGEYKAICHSKDTKISTSADVLETTTKDNGKGKRYEYGGKYETTLTVNGLTNTIDEADFSIIQDMILQSMKLPFLFTDNNNIQWTGSVLLTSFDLDSPDNAVSSFNGTFIVDGALTKTFTPDSSLPPSSNSVTITDQFGETVAVIPAPGNYAVLRFDTMDCRGYVNPDLIIIPDDVIW